MNFLVFWMDNLLISSQTEEGHLKHLELIFTYSEASIKLKMSNVNFSRKKLNT